MSSPALRVALIIVLSLAAITPRTEAYAQAANPTVETDEPMRRALESLPPRAQIRAISNGVSIRGRFLGISADTIRIATATDASVTLPFATVSELSTRETRGGRMAIVGAVFGALFVGTLAHTVESSIDAVLCEPLACEKQDNASSTALGILVGGAAGGAAGFAIGRTMVRWRVRYR